MPTTGAASAAPAVARGAVGSGPEARARKVAEADAWARRAQGKTEAVVRVLGAFKCVPLVWIAAIVVSGALNGIAYLVISLLSLCWAVLALRPQTLFLVGMQVVEAPLALLLPHLVVLALCGATYAGALSRPAYFSPGRSAADACGLAGVVAGALVMALMLWFLGAVLVSVAQLRRALREAGVAVSAGWWWRIDWSAAVIPHGGLGGLGGCFRGAVDVERDVAYAEVLLGGVEPAAQLRPYVVAPGADAEGGAALRLTCNVYSSPAHRERAAKPALLYIHGGAWMLGRKDFGVPHGMMAGAARTGWVVFSIDYRLAPQHSLADCLEDCKRALLWIRRPATLRRFGLDPGCVAVAGDSAGSHLAQLMALTQRCADWDALRATVRGDEADHKAEPDGEAAADFSVQGVVDFFAPTDTSDRDGHAAAVHNDIRVLAEDILFRGLPGTPDELHRRYSPYDYALALKQGQGPPCPWIGCHGSMDSLAPNKDHRQHYAALFASAGAARACEDAAARPTWAGKGTCGAAGVVRWEAPCAFHGFCSSPALRGQVAALAVCDMLRHCEKVAAAARASQHRAGPEQVIVQL
jgi:acetyl esterase/lipase